MKKIIFGLKVSALICAIIATTIISATAATPKALVYGDANGDGAVNIIEIVKIKKYLANFDHISNTSTVDISSTADVTGDNSINTEDLAKIKIHLLSHDCENIGNCPSCQQSGIAWSASSDLLSANTDLIIAPQIDNKKNCVYDVYAEFDTFTSLTLAHGKTYFQSSCLVIDKTYIKTYHYNGSTAVLMDTYEHGLTFSDYINVNIDLKHSNRGSVTVRTNGGEFSQNNAYFGGCRGETALSGGQDMYNARGSYYLRDIFADTWIFGDSYLSIGDPSKWTEQLIRKGYTDYLLCGFGGANSMQEIISFRNLIKKHTPKRICWCLGMNDGDKETGVNAKWKTVYDEVVEICNSKNIELILATVPNVPNIRHDYKNEIIRASGYRYIDFAKAVNAETVGSSWYAGMLSTDNVHPTELGAKALAERILLDVPEIAIFENKK